MFGVFIIVPIATLGLLTFIPYIRAGITKKKELEEKYKEHIHDIKYYLKQIGIYLNDKPPRGNQECIGRTANRYI